MRPFFRRSAVVLAAGSALLASFALRPAVAIAHVTIDMTFAVDPTASSIGPLDAAPLGGAVTGVFHEFDRSLTIGSASAVSPAATLTFSSTIPQADVLSTPLISASVAGVSSMTFPQALSLMPASGPIRNGESASNVLWVTQGLGSITANVNVTTNSIVTGSVITPAQLSATLAPAAAFNSPAASGAVVLVDTGAGAQLKLPFAMPFSVSGAQAQAGGLTGDVLNAVSGYFIAYATDFVNALSPLPGIVVGTSTTHLPATPQNVSYKVDSAQSFLAGSTVSGALAGTVAGRFVNGDLAFGGESAFGLTQHIGAISDIAHGTIPSVLGDVQYAANLDSLTLDWAFGLGSGYAWDGSSPTAIGWTVQGARFTMTGEASLASPLFSVTDAPFSISADLALAMDLADAGADVQLRRANGVETLVIPLAFDHASATVLDSQIDFSDSLLGPLAGVFAAFVIPGVEDAIVSDLEDGSYAGRLVATRGVAEDPAGGAANRVPIAPTHALVLVAMIAGMLVRPFRRRQPAGK